MAPVPSVRARPGCSSCLSILHSRSTFYGTFVSAAGRLAAKHGGFRPRAVQEFEDSECLAQVGHTVEDAGLWLVGPDGGAPMSAGACLNDNPLYPSVCECVRRENQVRGPAQACLACEGFARGESVIE